jgi:hypothetical protein
MRVYKRQEEYTKNTRNASIGNQNRNISEQCVRPQARLKLGKIKWTVSLAKVRLYLLLINLIVLVAGVVSLLAWKDAKWWADGQKGGLFLDSAEVPNLEEGEKTLILSMDTYIAQVLYISTINLFLYWIIYGVIISCRFGSSCDMCFLAISLPHTTMIIVWEIVVSVMLLRVLILLPKLPTHPMSSFYLSWSPWLTSLYLMACPVQLVTATLPFLISSLHGGGSVESPPAPVGRENTNSRPSPTTPNVTTISSLYHTEMPEQLLKKPHGRLSRIRKTSESAATAMHDMFDTMSRIYHGHSTDIPAWHVMDRPLPQPQLGIPYPPPAPASPAGPGGGLYLDLGGVHQPDDYIYPDEDYMDMWEAPPPPYSKLDPTAQGGRTFTV